MVVYIPRLERAELDDELEAQVLSQEVAVMRDGAWVFLYNNKVEQSPSFLQKRMNPWQKRMAHFRNPKNATSCRSKIFNGVNKPHASGL